jgi:magnesium transporter
VFAVLKIARLQEDEIKYVDIEAFVGANHIITVRHDDSADYLHAHEKFERGPKSRRFRPDFILHDMLDFVVSSYFPVVQMIEDDVLSMEHRLVDAFLSRDEVTRRFRLRRQAIHFQHMLTRMSDVCGGRTHRDRRDLRHELHEYARATCDLRISDRYRSDVVDLRGIIRALQDIALVVMRVNARRCNGENEAQVRHLNTAAAR